MGAMLFTQDGTAVEVEQIWVVSARQDAEGQWIQMGGRVALLPNGAYCYGDGNLLPFESKEGIRQVFTSRDREGNPCILPEMKWLLDAILEWFTHRDEHEGVAIKKVVFNRQGYPELEDGSPAEEADIYAYFEPGPALTAAIVGMSKRRESDAQMAKAAKPEIYREAPAPPPGQPKVAGDPVATRKQPPGLKPGKGWTPERLAKARATKEANRQARMVETKATPNPAPAQAAAG